MYPTPPVHVRVLPWNVSHCATGGQTASVLEGREARNHPQHWTKKLKSKELGKDTFQVLAQKTLPSTVFHSCGGAMFSLVLTLDVVFKGIVICSKICSVVWRCMERTSFTNPVWYLLLFFSLPFPSSCWAWRAGVTWGKRWCSWPMWMPQTRLRRSIRLCHALCVAIRKVEGSKLNPSTGMRITITKHCLEATTLKMMWLTSMITPQVSVTMAWSEIPSTSWLSSLVFSKLPQMKTGGLEGHIHCCFRKACIYYPARSLKASKLWTCCLPRTFCRVHRKLCSGPVLVREGAQSRAASGNLTFSGQILFMLCIEVVEVLQS